MITYLKNKVQGLSLMINISTDLQDFSRIILFRFRLIKPPATLRFLFNKKPILFYIDSYAQFRNILGLLNEFQNEYKKLNVKGMNVVDIGANIGDTAIGFSALGAKHVYAFEPYPYSFALACKNIEINHMNGKITLLNEGCGRQRIVTINPYYISGIGDDLKESKTGIKIKIISLNEIVKKYNLRNAVMKIDCEGAEYEIIEEATQKTLSNFNHIIIEYHYGLQNILKKLRQVGFKVTNTEPRGSYVLTATNPHMQIGIINAERTNAKPF